MRIFCHSDYTIFTVPSQLSNQSSGSYQKGKEHGQNYTFGNMWYIHTRMQFSFVVL